MLAARGLGVSGRRDQDRHADAIAKRGGAARDDAAIRKHLEEIISSDAFSSSHRCQSFLTYVVTKALAGDLDGLKERSIGIDLFGRTPLYDTAEDAIVRVTASDVRKRLLQYYGKAGVEPLLRITLPAGSYVPEFHAGGRPPAEHGEAGVAAEAAAADSLAAPDRGRTWLRRAAVVVGLCAAFLLGFWVRPPAARRLERQSVAEGTPWPQLFRQGRRTYLVVCDTDIAMVQNLLRRPIALSDYANRQYLSSQGPFGPEGLQILGRLVARDYSASTAVVDTQAALSIAELAHAFGHPLEARSARMMRLQDFDTDDDYILMGSPLSNPWTALFEEQLDFVFEFNQAVGKEVCRNRRPREGESGLYDPSATWFKTGDAFAIISFLPNRERAGHVLIIAGSNAEATGGAARFITNPRLVAATLAQHGLVEKGAARPFQALMHLKTMAGAPSTTEVIAVHPLAGSNASSGG